MSVKLKIFNAAIWCFNYVPSCGELYYLSTVFNFIDVDANFEFYSVNGIYWWFTDHRTAISKTIILLTKLDSGWK